MIFRIRRFFFVFRVVFLGVIGVWGCGLGAYIFVIYFFVFRVRWLVVEVFRVVLSFCFFFVCFVFYVYFLVFLVWFFSSVFVF